MFYEILSCGIYSQDLGIIRMQILNRYLFRTHFMFPQIVPKLSQCILRLSASTFSFQLFFLINYCLFKLYISYIVKWIIFCNSWKYTKYPWLCVVKYNIWGKKLKIAWKLYLCASTKYMYWIIDIVYIFLILTKVKKYQNIPSTIFKLRLKKFVSRMRHIE